MKIAIAAVGHRQPTWVQDGCNEYLRRLPREFSARLIEIRAEARDGRNRAQLLAAEKTRILTALEDYPRRIALDERGRDLTTRQFADEMDAWMQDGAAVAFLIGGADGLDATLKSRAHCRLRLSSLTLPHGIARLLLCEQIYRAISLMKNHPYHRE
ncbi:MAG: 23S rRNA (pseudouridine(1915)-N(3))-methyltransferase RlmH [Zoogloeaceae bacterium]|jgi:23S rRNA (pseudouridine1915-N3)-methyltransferase|nr:23S rRNA (pseudouridine(1915)-N(3))-methyltransferase RlmH [Zoogloeaceae bacterium]